MKKTGYKVKSKTLFGTYETKRTFKTKAEAERVVKINREAQKKVRGGWKSTTGGRDFVPKNTFRVVKAKPKPKKRGFFR